MQGHKEGGFMIRKTFHSLNNNNGAAMIIAILLVAVMSLLGTALWMYSTTDTLHVSHEEKKVQAYYVARSAADTVAEYMIKNALDAQSIISTTGVTGTSTTNNVAGMKDFNVTITDKGNNIIDIEAIGRVNDISDKATLRVKRTAVNSNCTFDNAIFSMTDIGFNGNKFNISGSVTANGTITGLNLNSHISGSRNSPCNPPWIYPTLGIPDGTTFTKYTESKYYNNSIPITDNLEFEDISGKMNLTFDVSKNNIYLKVGSYSSSDITIIGTPSIYSVYMYVDSFTITGNSQINPGTTASSSNFVLVPNPNAYIDLTTKGTSSFKGVVYAPYVDIRSAGTPNFIGAIIAHKFTGSGDIIIQRPSDLDEFNIPGATPYSGFEKVQWR